MLGIGTKLRDARVGRNLSLRDLAGLTDVSASLISQIENDKVNPSVRTLHSLADALALPINYFFPDSKHDSDGLDAFANATHDVRTLTASQMRMQQSAPTENGAVAADPMPATDGSPVLRAQARPTIELQGDVTWSRLTPQKEANAELMEISYASGATSGARMSHHSGREFVLVQCGELTLELGFDVYELAAGDSAIFDSATPHRLSNRGNEPMCAISILLLA